MIKRNDDEDVFDERGVLKDGRTYRVPGGLFFVDGLGSFFNDTANPQSPSRTVALSDAQRLAKEKLVADYNETLSERWRSPPSTTAIADGSKQAPAAISISDAYAAYDRRVSNAWKGGSA